MATQDASDLIHCPVCATFVTLAAINTHLDTDCGRRDDEVHVEDSDRDSGEPMPSSAASFFTPTQARHAKVKKEAHETLSPLTRSSQKRKTAPDADVHTSAHAYSGTMHQGRGAAVSAAPLADRVRPTTLADFTGQRDLIGPDGLLRGLIEAGKIPSLILWGASGTGKTTLARIMAKSAPDAYVFKELSATSNNVADCKKVFEEAANLLKLTGKKTLVFLDECHRFTKSQQDVFLPYVESGRITLIGATTENPSFRINNALISRCRVFTLGQLTAHDVERILHRALTCIDETIPEDILVYLAGLCDGDARVALNLLEVVLSLPRATLSIDAIKTSLKRTTIAYDRVGDKHYDTISALHKSVRGSDVDASLYYLGRMLESGDDPLYIARRMIRIASEDVGMADCAALTLCSAIYTSVQQVGMPEADCILAQGIVYLAQAPKSIDVYKAYKRVKEVLRKEDGAATAEIPLHLRNAPTRLMAQMGYAKDYQYTPECGVEVEQQYMPASLNGHVFYKQDEFAGPTVWHEMDSGERLL